MKKLMIGAGMILFLMGTAYGIMYFIGIDLFADKTFEETGEETGEETFREKVKIIPGEYGKVTFIEMEVIVVPLFSGSKITGNIQLKIQLQVTSGDNRLKVQRLLPKISDVFLRDLYDYLPRYLKENDRINPLDLKQRLLHRLNTSVEKNLVLDMTIKTLSTKSMR